jgi:hypothetical protein
MLGRSSSTGPAGNLFPVSSPRSFYAPLRGPSDDNKTCNRTIASSSDIDLFLYGLEDEDAAIKRIFELEAQIRGNQRLSSDGALALRTEHAITFISPKYPYRHVQVRY